MAGDLLKDLLLEPSASAMAQAADPEADAAPDTDMLPADQSAERPAEWEVQPAAAEPATAVSPAEQPTAHPLQPREPTGNIAALLEDKSPVGGNAAPHAKQGDATQSLLEAAGLAEASAGKEVAPQESRPEVQSGSCAPAQPAPAGGLRALELAPSLQLPLPHAACVNVHAPTAFASLRFSCGAGKSAM